MVPAMADLPDPPFPTNATLTPPAFLPLPPDCPQLDDLGQSGRSRRLVDADPVEDLDDPGDLGPDRLAPACRQAGPGAVGVDHSYIVGDHADERDAQLGAQRP